MKAFNKNFIKKKKIKFFSKKTPKLTNFEKKQIAVLKNTHWKYGFKSNLDWMNKNLNKDDVHNIIKFNNEIIGYTLLRLRNLFFFKKNIKTREEKFFYFDTLIIDKKFRKEKIGSYLMKCNNYLIKKNKKKSILICKKLMVNFYKKNYWKLATKNFKINDHTHRKKIMFFNFQGNKFDKISFNINSF